MNKYIDELYKILKKIKQEDIERIVKLIIRINKVYIIGNGGSSAIASHFAQDLIKFAGIKAFSVDNLSIVTAYSNDNSFDFMFVDYLNSFIGVDDILIAFSTSGKSVNLINAFKNLKCNNKIGICGNSGGYLKTYSDDGIWFESNYTQALEDIFSVISHLITIKIRELKGE